MEVHAHTHTERKKWTHYFWEFFMLFLAVSAGFFMENQREHYVELRRERDYIKALLEDLKTDTAFFSSAIKRNTSNQVLVDSLIFELKNYKSGNPAPNIYYLARNATVRGERTQHTDRTFGQLKSSGGLRLIHNRTVLDSISRYYELMKWLDFQILGRNERLNDLYIANADLFDAWVMNSISDSNYKKPIEAPPLLLTDKLTLNRYVTRLAYFKASDRGILRKTINEFLPNAIRLINMIQKEYHLK